MSVPGLTKAARRARESTRIRVAWVLAALLLLAPSVVLTTQDPLLQPPEYRWLYSTLWHLGISGLFLFAVMHLVAGYSDYLLFCDTLTDRYSDAHVLFYAITNRTGALGGITLLIAGALGVGFVTGIALVAIAAYTIVWAVLFGLVMGLPLNPIDGELDELNTAE